MLYLATASSTLYYRIWKKRLKKKNTLVYLKHFFCMGHGHKSDGWYRHTRRSGLQEHVRADKKHVVLQAVH